MNPPNTLYYDGECPFCERYADYVRLRESIGLTIVNAREAPEAIAKFRRRGYAIDQGMILVLEGQIYHGADAIHALEIALHPGPFGRIFLRPWLLRMVYPVLKVFRLIALKLKGKTDQI